MHVALSLLTSSNPVDFKQTMLNTKTVKSLNTYTCAHIYTCTHTCTRVRACVHVRQFIHASIPPILCTRVYDLSINNVRVKEMKASPRYALKLCSLDLCLTNVIWLRRGLPTREFIGTTNQAQHTSIQHPLGIALVG